MARMRLAIILLMFFSILGLAGCAHSLKATSLSKSEEYAIYSMLVDSSCARAKAKTAFIDARTVIGSPFDFPAEAKNNINDTLLVAPQSVESYAAKHSGFDWSELEANYRIKNAKVWQLEEELFKLAELGIFPAERGKVPSVISFSRIGFNKNHDQVLVYVEYSYNMARDHGSYLILRKALGIWRVENSLGAWLS